MKEPLVDSTVMDSIPRKLGRHQQSQTMMCGFQVISPPLPRRHSCICTSCSQACENNTNAKLFFSQTWHHCLETQAFGQNTSRWQGKNPSYCSDPLKQIKSIQWTWYRARLPLPTSFQIGLSAPSRLCKKRKAAFSITHGDFRFIIHNTPLPASLKAQHSDRTSLSQPKPNSWVATDSLE